MHQVAFLKTKTTTKPAVSIQTLYIKYVGKNSMYSYDCCQVFFVCLFLNKHSKEAVLGEKEELFLKTKKRKS